MPRTPQVVDTVTARELEIFADETHALYLTLHDTYLAALLRKAWRGVYDRALSVKMLEHYVRGQVIPAYIRENYTRGTKVSHVANGATIHAVAESYAQSLYEGYIEDALKETEELLAKKAAAKAARPARKSAARKTATLAGRPKRRTLSINDAYIELREAGFPFREDYFALDNTKREMLLEVMDRATYRAPANRPGSPSRSFHKALTLEAARADKRAKAKAAR